MLSDGDSNTSLSIHLYGLIEATDLALRFHGLELSKDNFTTHDWSILSKDTSMKIFHCNKCLLLCGLTSEDGKFKILSMTNLSCNELKFQSILK